MWGCCCSTGCVGSKKCIPCSCIQMDVIPSPSHPSSWSVLFGSILLQIKRRGTEFEAEVHLIYGELPTISLCWLCYKKRSKERSCNGAKRRSKATLLHQRQDDQISLRQKNLLMTEPSGFSEDDVIGLDQGLFLSSGINARPNSRSVSFG